MISISKPFTLKMDSLSTEEMCFMMESLSLDEHQPGLMTPQEEAHADWKAVKEQYRNKLYRLMYTDEEQQRREEERQAERWLDEEEEQHREDERQAKKWLEEERRANDEKLDNTMAKARDREHAILEKIDEGWSNVSEPTDEDEEQFQRIKHDIEMLLQEQLDDVETMRQQLRDQLQQQQQQQPQDEEEHNHYEADAAIREE